jgi:hypothetical protein
LIGGVGQAAATPRAGVVRAALLAALVLAGLLTGVVAVAALAGANGAALEAGAGSSVAEDPGRPSPLARREIPGEYLRLYIQAARRYALDWAVLAGIGEVECDHGRDPDPSCATQGAVNSAGAGGPMQFIAATWARYGVDGNADGVADRWDAADAIFAAARYLAASGAPRDYRAALFAYNHASWYVADVEAWAARYRGSTSAAAPGPQSPEEQEAAPTGADTSLQAQTTTPVRFIAGQRAELSAGDGHVALIPVSAPSVVQAMIVSGNELQGLPYGPAGHPDPRGAPAEDCSSTVNYVLYRSGVRPIAEILRDNPLAQDYMRWGLAGPGRWVTIYSTTAPTDHTFMTIAGLRLDTSHNGTDVGPNAAQDGPRWRLLDRIPAWAHWSVRHPPGL